MSSNTRIRNKRFSSTEINNLLCESESSDEDFICSDEEDDYIAEENELEGEVSDAEPTGIIEADEDSYDSDETNDSNEMESRNAFFGKDGSSWLLEPFPQTQTPNRNVLRQCGGAAQKYKLCTPKQIFESILSPEMCDIILRETNRKMRKIAVNCNTHMGTKSVTAKNNLFKPFVVDELNAFFGLLIHIHTYIHKSNREHISELWKPINLPLFRAAMSLSRFKLLLRCIRFDNDETRLSRAKSDKAAAFRDIWIMLNANLRQSYKPSECITVDEQLYGYRGRTRFTQYMPAKPEKYGIKIFWACDASNSFPLHGQLYTGKPTESERQTNVGERTVLDLVSPYKNSGRNVTTDNFFTSLELAKALSSWNLTLVGTVRKNKRFIPANMQAHKDRQLFSTNFVFRKETTLCSYVPKKKKAVIMLSTMHFTPSVENTLTAKPEIIKYYNKTKGGVDNMDKLLGEYTCKRRTSRWPLSLFFNAIDVAALASYIIYMEHNTHFTSTDRRRTFLKDLSVQLSIENIKRRAKNPKVMAKAHTRTAIDIILGKDFDTTVHPYNSNVQRDKSGRIAVAGSCKICSKLRLKQRKTRKTCSNCSIPICNSHSVNRPICTNCLQDDQPK